MRVASIRNLALQFDADIGHADHVARLALQLHDSLVAEGVFAPAPDERGLLWAAALLHDVGMTIGYDGHPDHAHYLILTRASPATARARSRRSPRSSATTARARRDDDSRRALLRCCCGSRSSSTAARTSR